MAAAHAQLTGRPGVCLVTAGPGCTNLLTGIAEAYVGSLPIIVLAGRAATATALRGAAQEVATDRIFAPVTKWSVRVDRADLVAEVLRQAFTLARSGRPGPVLVDLPRDILDAEIEHATYQAAGPPPRPAADEALVARAADALAGATRPLLVAGGGRGRVGRSPSSVALAELLAIPVLTSLSGRGSIPDDHPLSAGGLGAHRNRSRSGCSPRPTSCSGSAAASRRWRPTGGRGRCLRRTRPTSRSTSSRARSAAACPRRSASSATSEPC